MPDDPFSSAMSGVSDIFSGIGDEYKAKGMGIEAQNYREAASFAGLHADIQAQSTKVQTAQIQRQVYQVTGQARAAVASSGFTSGGSASDIMRSSAQQGALQKAVANQSGQVAEQGYREEQKSDLAMAKAADVAERADKTAATGSFVSGALKMLPMLMMM